jgi:hypothetical protein
VQGGVVQRPETPITRSTYLDEALAVNTPTQTTGNPGRNSWHISGLSLLLDAHLAGSQRYRCGSARTGRPSFVSLFQSASGLRESPR